MATEFKLSYTGSEINRKLGEIEIHLEPLKGKKKHFPDDLWDRLYLPKWSQHYFPSHIILVC